MSGAVRWNFVPITDISWFALQATIIRRDARTRAETTRNIFRPRFNNPVAYTLEEMYMVRRFVRIALKAAGAALAVTALTGSRPAGAWSFYSGFALGRSPSALVPADLSSSPDYSTWDQSVTYRFDPTFDAAFPRPEIKDQVRQAFATWNAVARTPRDATNSFLRATAFQPFGDIRSIALHEIGHLVGLAHTDEAAARGSNFRQDATFTLRSVPATTQEVMYSTLAPGAYNHILSWDELESVQWGYTHFGAAPERFPIFREADRFGTADVIIRAAPLPRDTTWADTTLSGEYRDRTRPWDGARITSGVITFNATSRYPTGLKTLAVNWDVTMRDVATRVIAVRTKGTDSPNPLWHYDNAGPNPFVYEGTGRPSPISPAGGKDELTHVWDRLAIGDIPAGNLFHVGLEQDVWDWTLGAASVMTPSGVWTGPPMLAVHEWSRSILRGMAGTRSPRRQPQSSSFFAFGSLDRQNACALEMSEVGDVTARGFVIQASDVTSVVDRLSIAVVDGMNLQLPALNGPTMTKLAQQKLLQTFKEFGAYKLGPGEELYVILKGTESDLPDEIRTRGNYILLNRPDLLDKELFVYTRSRTVTDDILVGNYALLGRKPITN